ncbi:MAG TPA: hypothetical protein ENH24_00555 [Nitrospirae bacterium]|nr:hypothetical protein [Nitrospirota bacterium]
MTKVHESKIRITGDTKRGVTAVSRVTGSLKKMVPSMQQVKIGAAIMAAAVAGTTLRRRSLTVGSAKHMRKIAIKSSLSRRSAQAASIKRIFRIRPYTESSITQTCKEQGVRLRGTS